ncbi:hypothetical protein KPH14_012755 [Odynerus spinipes]|uniref:Pre-C2HC domain-containing protein n=1 Tax=Odynerus spinipes TaxID=1348599 RepID=A0AAD9VIT1_9HYME|nr:hypothetical protein KPH14_012755 [Odynerus spinipes]
MSTVSRNKKTNSGTNDKSQKWLINPQIICNNRFEQLSNLDEKVKTKENKPQPIFMDADNLQPLTNLINNDLQILDYTIKCTYDNQVKLQTESSESYRKIIQTPKENNASYYTFQPKDNRKYKVVIRGLHHSISHETIKEELESLNHQVCNVTNIKSSYSGNPLPLHIIETMPNENNKEIFQINKLANTIIQVEQYRTKRDIPQCANCQKHGHTKNYCNRDPICVKCAQSHPSQLCPQGKKIKDVTCSNCHGKHPANYKGCKVRKEIQEKLFSKIRHRDIMGTEKRASSQNIKDDSVYTPKSQQNKQRPTYTTPVLSYAQVANQETQYNEEKTCSSTGNMDSKIDKLTTIMEQQMQQISMMMNILIKLLALLERNQP